jgi:peptide chain release factor subunit 1
MARTVSWDALRELAGFRAEKGCAISFYLDLDPSVSPTAGDAMTRVNALLSEGERSYADKISGLTHDEKRGLKADFARIGSYLQHDFDRDGAHGLALFVAGMDNVFTPIALTRPVPDEVRVARTFYLAPLVPLVGRGDGAIVAVVSREQGRLYRLSSGRLVELGDLSEEQPRRHDQGGWSQANYQRHIDNMVAQHVEDVAEELDRQLRRNKGSRAVIVSTEEMRSEFEGALPNEARQHVIGWTHARAHATPTELLHAVEPVLENWRHGLEAEVLARWREEAGRNGRAASGWEQTLEAASDARVEVLLFAAGVERKAWQCPKCGRVDANPGNCPLDGTRMDEHEDGLDLAVHQVLANGGTVWALKDRRDLDPVEGIAALLRF